MRRREALGGLLVFGLAATLVTSSGRGQPPRPGPAPGPVPSPGPRPGPAATLGQPLAGLSTAELARFNAGLRVFQQQADPPAGLGPVFNDNACVRCHGGGAVGGGSPRMAVRFGRITNGQFDPMVEFGGPLLQDKGIGRFKNVNFVGETVPAQATIVARRRTTPVFGLGLVDAVPDSVFVQLAQHQHQVTPLTAGRPSPTIDPATGAAAVGKFGWKAQQPNLFAFAADALVNEMGITTPVFPQENCPQGNCALLAANPARTQPNAPTTTSVRQLADFMALLAPPPPGPASADANAGRAVFATIGCADCHQPTLQTGPNAVAALNGVTFAPYSDFLLHDMGPLGDGVVQNQAGPHEMRTAPLWGLRFAPSYLHDGRAQTPSAAILAHDGQGKPARDRFNALTPTQRNQLLTFLNSL
ncbi:MAG: di-heme oxidoredictase family protein [Isosphaeraceae bacterium]